MDATFATLELDFNGQHSAVTPPVVEIRPIEYARNQTHNTDFVGFETNSDGEHIGRIYESVFSMPVSVSTLVASQSGNNSRDLMSQIRTALWYYDTSVMGNALPSTSSDTEFETDIRRLSVGDSEPQNDLTLSPGLRRTQQLVDTVFVEQINTTDYMTDSSPIRSISVAGEDYAAVDSDSVSVDDSPSIVLGT